MSDFLNQLSSTIAPSTGFRQLAPGKYDGTITGIVQKELNGSPVWEIDVTTPQGKTNALIWGFNPTDLQLAEQDFRAGNQDSKYLQGVTKTIDKAKKMLCETGVWDSKNIDDIRTRPWSGGERSVLGSLAKMIGKTCSVVVQPRHDDATKMNVFINAPRPTGNSTVPSFDQPIQSQFDISKAPTLDSISF